jgi:GntR family transcriptional regulator
MDKETAVKSEAEFKPLYTQVKVLIRKRISSGEWKPGALIPNEFQLAVEFNVSQGTVRKALIALEAERLIVRHQGRGTYVARHTRERALFHFFRMVGLDDERVEPTSLMLGHKSVSATTSLATALEIERGARLHRIIRIRTLKDIPAIFERIYAPEKLLPDLMIEAGEEMIDEMYVIYQERYGITIAHASERLAAVTATAEDARLLQIPVATPLLEITRIARDIDKTAIEVRISRYRTDLFRYAAELN